jgi:hypothetical protein
VSPDTHAIAVNLGASAEIAYGRQDFLRAVLEALHAVISGRLTDAGLVPDQAGEAMAGKVYAESPPDAAVGSLLRSGAEDEYHRRVPARKLGKE